MKASFILTLLIVVVVLISYHIINWLKQPEANFNKNPTNGQSNSNTNGPIHSSEYANFNLPVETTIKSFDKYGEAPFSHCEFKINGDMHNNSPIFTGPNQLDKTPEVKASDYPSFDVTRGEMALVNVDRKLKHLFDGSDWNVYDENVLNLGVGAPGPDLLQNCCDIFEAATKHRLKYEKQSNLSYLFQYGPTSGSVEIRNAIAEYFSSLYVDDPVKSEDLIITTGASQGLHFVLSTLLDLNGVIFVDEVTYMIALDTLKQFTTLTIVPLKLNDDGVDVKELEKIVREKRFQSKSKIFWAMYYTIPTYHNPTGILFSEAVCQELANLARQYDFLILCDDVYNILNYTSSKPTKRLFAYDNGKGNIISNGSFAKLIGPGVRVGWLEVPARLKPILENSGILNSGGCFNNYTSGILASLFELKLAQEHIAIVKRAYKERLLAACEILEKSLPVSCKWIKPSGGYFIWISLPTNTDAGKLLQTCLQDEKIFFVIGSRFAYEPLVANNCLRLSISFHKKDKLVDGVTRLCAVLKRYLQEPKK